MARKRASAAKRATAAAPTATASKGGASDRTVGWTVFVTGILITFFLFWRNHDTRFGYVMRFDEYNLLNTAFVLGVPLLIALLILGRDASEFGLQPGERAQGVGLAIVAFAAFLPVIWYFAPEPGSQSYYLDWLSQSRAYMPTSWIAGRLIPEHVQWDRLLYHETAMLFYMLGWEFFFRGYLLNGVRKIAPVWFAVLFQAILFTAMHWSKPPAEVASSFPGAILMAILALRTRSVLPCVLLHFLVSAGFDLAVLYFHFHPR